jgi:hypothetical protein
MANVRFTLKDDLNLAAQANVGSRASHISIFKDPVALRRQKTRRGDTIAVSGFSCVFNEEL